MTIGKTACNYLQSRCLLSVDLYIGKYSKVEKYLALENIGHWDVIPYRSPNVVFPCRQVGNSGLFNEYH